MKTIELTTNAQVEIITAYVAPNTHVEAVAATPGWYVAGSFFVGSKAENARLEAIGVVSDASVTMHVRLFDLTDAEPVVGSTINIQSLVDSRGTSALFDVAAGHTYQIQVEAIGGAGGDDDLFGILKSANLL